YVGRVADDQVEALARDRREKVAFPEFHPAHSVEARVEPREGDGTRVLVHGDDAVAVARGEEGLDAPAHAEIEGAAHTPPDGQAIEGDGGRVGPEDVVGLENGRLLRIRRVVGQNQVAMDGEPHAGTDTARA